MLMDLVSEDRVTTIKASGIVYRAFIKINEMSINREHLIPGNSVANRLVIQPCANNLFAIKDILVAADLQFEVNDALG